MQSQSEQITQYLETIILLHSGDDKLLKSMFDVQKLLDEKSLLTPTGKYTSFRFFN